MKREHRKRQQREWAQIMEWLVPGAPEEVKQLPAPSSTEEGPTKKVR